MQFSLIWILDDYNTWVLQVITMSKLIQIIYLYFTLLYTCISHIYYRKAVLEQFEEECILLFWNLCNSWLKQIVKYSRFRSQKTPPNGLILFLNSYMTILSLTNRKVRSNPVKGRKSSVSAQTLFLLITKPIWFRILTYIGKLIVARHVTYSVWPFVQRKRVSEKSKILLKNTVIKKNWQLVESNGTQFKKYQES